MSFEVTSNLAGKGVTTWSFYNGTLYIVISFLTKEFMNSCVSFSVSVLFFTQRK